MILADKIAVFAKEEWMVTGRTGKTSWECLVKQFRNGESASSIPDLDKIVKMSLIFGVSTDYLLKGLS